MYVKLNNGVIERYPYSIGDLQRSMPNTSFPGVMSAESLAQHEVYQVKFVGAPSVDHTKNVNEGLPVNANGVWRQTWVVSDASADEIAERVNYRSGMVRGERSRLIAGTDWTQLPDAPLTEAKRIAWANYRQALRNITTQAGFPWDVKWPIGPG